MHTATGKSPAELLFGRKIRTNIPYVDDCYSNVEVCEKDSEYKGRSKLYTDTRRNAQLLEIDVGATVLVQNENSGKAEPRFSPVPLTVTNVTIEPPEGKQYEREISKLKRYYTAGNVIVVDVDGIVNPQDNGISW